MARNADRLLARIGGARADNFINFALASTADMDSARIVVLRASGAIVDDTITIVILVIANLRLRVIRHTSGDLFTISAHQVTFTEALTLTTEVTGVCQIIVVDGLALAIAADGLQALVVRINTIGIDNTGTAKNSVAAREIIIVIARAILESDLASHPGREGVDTISHLGIHRNSGALIAGQIALHTVGELLLVETVHQLKVLGVRGSHVVMVHGHTNSVDEPLVASSDGENVVTSVGVRDLTNIDLLVGNQVASDNIAVEALLIAKLFLKVTTIGITVGIRRNTLIDGAAKAIVALRVDALMNTFAEFDITEVTSAGNAIVTEVMIRRVGASTRRITLIDSAVHTIIALLVHRNVFATSLNITDIIRATNTIRADIIDRSMDTDSIDASIGSTGMSIVAVGILVGLTVTIVIDTITSILLELRSGKRLAVIHNSSVAADLATLVLACTNSALDDVTNPIVVVDGNAGGASLESLADAHITDFRTLRILAILIIFAFVAKRIINLASLILVTRSNFTFAGDLAEVVIRDVAATIHRIAEISGTSNLIVALGVIRSMSTSTLFGITTINCTIVSISALRVLRIVDASTSQGVKNAVIVGAGNLVVAVVLDFFHIAVSSLRSGDTNRNGAFDVGGAIISIFINLAIAVIINAIARIVTRLGRIGLAVGFQLTIHANLLARSAAGTLAASSGLAHEVVVVDSFALVVLVTDDLLANVLRRLTVTSDLALATAHSFLAARLVGHRIEIKGSFRLELTTGDGHIDVDVVGLTTSVAFQATVEVITCNVGELVLVRVRIAGGRGKINVDLDIAHSPTLVQLHTHDKVTDVLNSS